MHIEWNAAHVRKTAMEYEEKEKTRQNSEGRKSEP